jgi:FKBP-type peptidyl-prolyl cis-trans isomerase SlyD
MTNNEQRVSNNEYRTFSTQDSYFAPKFSNMQIEKHKVVGIDYTLTIESGQVVDQSKEGFPLYFIQGIGNLIPGLEEALEGKKTGDTLKVSIPPSKGYGDKQEEMIQKVEIAAFGDQPVAVGMQFTASAGDHQYNVMVTDVSATHVTVDANHPLAGQTLHFDVTVQEIRDALPDEISHGHVHGPGGHHH